ncbi:MAG: PEP-CTERM-box response regulator transcription factor [Candidatus Rokubacteria bacterium]|nr:PEP-CTERM-box response regulator transcription factor [Candidatus Rokubacteria bacterium]
MNKSKLLLVEDDEAVSTQLKYALRDDFSLLLAEDGSQAIRVFEESRPTFVCLDLGLPPHPDTADEGMKVLDEILAREPSSKVVVLTGNRDRENALRAIQLGAFDYHLKPIDLVEFKVVLRRAVYLHGLEQESESWVRGTEGGRFADILGNTAAMRKIFSVIQRVARSDVTVLVEGESGTGKELIARAVHAASRRAHGPFVPINCGAIPDTLLESELFGHEKGAFTGAHMQRKGRVELASGGTLFLDEIGELPLLLQVKLLRFLQERTIERVGGREEIQLELRVVAATNRDLKAQTQRALFREDLYYRLSVVTIQVPPLRERGEDVILLANHYLRRFAREQHRRLRFGVDALQALTAYSWPGNIRELENKVSRAVIMTSSKVIGPGDLDLESVSTVTLEPTSLRSARDRAEHEVLIDALTRHRGNISQAAAELGVSRPTLHGLLDKHSIDAKSFK